MVSRCCNKEVHIAESVTPYYVCNNCGHPCQLRLAIRNKTNKINKINKGNNENKENKDDE